jgi:chromosome segregation ATPase
LASEFCLLNRRNHQDAFTKETEVRQLHLEHLCRIRELEVERDFTAGKIAQLRERSDQSSSELATNRHKVDNLEEQIGNLMEKLQPQRLKLRESVEALKTSQLEMNTLSLQATQYEQEANLSAQNSEKLRTRVQDDLFVEIQKLPPERDPAALGPQPREECRPRAWSRMFITKELSNRRLLGAMGII